MSGLSISILTLIAFALNVPFGAYRATTTRLSARWFLALHLPIPFILLLRLASGHSYRVIPLLVAASVAGQLLGSWGYGRWRAARTAGRPVAVSVAIDERVTETIPR